MIMQGRWRRKIDNTEEKILIFVFLNKYDFHPFTAHD